MKNEEIRDLLEEVVEDAVLFDNPAFDNSIIGTTEEGGVAYDFSKMVQELMKDDNISEFEAIEFIEYNTIRSLPYTATLGVPPTIVYTDDFNTDN